jgi:hypothetical protein
MYCAPVVSAVIDLNACCGDRRRPLVFAGISF